MIAFEGVLLVQDLFVRERDMDMKNLEKFGKFSLSLSSAKSLYTWEESVKMDENEKKKEKFWMFSECARVVKKTNKLATLIAAFELQLH